MSTSPVHSLSWPVPGRAPPTAYTTGEGRQKVIGPTQGPAVTSMTHSAIYTFTCLGLISTHLSLRRLPLGPGQHEPPPSAPIQAL